MTGFTSPSSAQATSTAGFPSNTTNVEATAMQLRDACKRGQLAEAYRLIRTSARDANDVLLRAGFAVLDFNRHPRAFWVHAQSQIARACALHVDGYALHDS